MSSRSNPAVDSHCTTPLRVLLWYRRGAGLHFSGPGRTAYRMYAQADPGRFEVSLVHGNPEHESYELFHRQIGLGRCGESVPSQLLFLSRASRWLKKHHNEYDVFHGLSGYLVTLSPALLAHRLGLPAVVKLIAWRADMSDKRGWKTWLGVSRRRRQQLAELDAVIAIAPAIADELLEYGVPAERIARIPNGVDVRLYRPCAGDESRSALRAELGWQDLPTVLFAGGINRRKQPHLLIEALGQLRRDGREVQLVLAGPEDDAEYASQMRRRATELGVAGRVRWPGFCREMANQYRAADLFALPSRLEGMPNSVLEAMASGVPSLVTRIPGSVDLIDDQQCGLHVEPSGPSLAEAVRFYLDHPAAAREHAVRAREKVERQFDVRAVLDAHERLFRAIRTGGEAAAASLF